MSWYSNILTNTTSRISTLRSTLLGGDTDGDTEDDTHVCRVLRAYYTEKGRSFPNWLPPDPKAPPPPVATPAVSGVGSRYGGGALSSGGGGLSSLWDNNPANGSPANTSSLRTRPPPAAARASPFARNSTSSDPSHLGSHGGGRENYQSPSNTVQARPLPSQRLGSYQSAHSAPPVNSAQDKLRNLFGSNGSASNSRSASPAQGAGPGAPPGGGGGGGYGRNPYGASAGGAPESKPFMGANAPWANDDYQYSGGGGSGGRRPGLPSGPRRR